MKKNKSNIKTDQYEIVIITGVYFIMAYNRVPSLHLYWSSNSSLGNKAYKQVISRNRFQLLTSKLYFNQPRKT